VGETGQPPVEVRKSDSDPFFSFSSRRDAYDGWDSAMTASGSIAIVIAFALKIFNA
jgi:hypothetical protein